MSKWVERRNRATNRIQLHHQIDQAFLTFLAYNMGRPGYEAISDSEAAAKMRYESGNDAHGGKIINYTHPFAYVWQIVQETIIIALFVWYINFYTL